MTNSHHGSQIDLLVIQLLDDKFVNHGHPCVDAFLLARDQYSRVCQFDSSQFRVDQSTGTCRCLRKEVFLLIGPGTVVDRPAGGMLSPCAHFEAQHGLRTIGVGRHRLRICWTNDASD